MDLTYKYRLYPTAQQTEMIHRTCGCARYLYNTLLTRRTKAYRETGVWKKMDSKALQDEMPFLKEVDPSALQWAENSLKRAYRHYFHIRRTELDQYRPESILKSQCDEHYLLKDTDLVGYPRLKQKKRTKMSYSTSSQDVVLQENSVELPMIGRVKMRYHRPIPQDAKIVFYTVIIKPSGNTFLLIHIQIPDVETRKDLEKPIGVVFVPGQLCVRSDMVPVQYYEESHELRKKIEQAYKTLQRRTPGSKRWERQRLILAKLYEKRTNQRHDSLHKISRQITNAADAVFMEKPDVLVRKQRMKTGGERHVVWDEAWYSAYEKIRYKAEKNGKVVWTVVEAYPIYSLCSACDRRTPESAPGDIWKCPHCKTEMKSEWNAAKNLENLAAKHIRELKEQQNLS